MYTRKQIMKMALKKVKESYKNSDRCKICKDPIDSQFIPSTFTLPVINEKGVEEEIEIGVDMCEDCYENLIGTLRKVEKEIYGERR